MGKMILNLKNYYWNKKNWFNLYSILIDDKEIAQIENGKLGEHEIESGTYDCVIKEIK